MATTPNYGLKKPDYTDSADIKVAVNDNMDIIDTALANKMENIGNETVQGVKTFLSSPIVPTPINPTDAVNKTYIDSTNARFYGKYSLLTGGGSVSSSNNSVAQYISYSTEANDDFNAINLGASLTKITIPSGVAVVRFYFRATLSATINGGGSASAVATLRKNGADVIELARCATSQGSTPSDSTSNTSFGWTEPIAVTAGEYFEMYAVCTSVGVSFSASVGASVFGMEVLK